MNGVILGCSHVHSHKYVRLSKEIRDFNIVGVAEENYPLALDFSTKYSIPYYSDYKNLLKEKAEIAIICSPTSNHKELVLLAAEAGKNILMEKPLALSLEEGEEIINTCRDKGVKLMVAFPFRYLTSVTKTKEILEEGRIGIVTAINCTKRGKMPGDWFVKKELSGGGAIIDHSVHVADIINYLMNTDIKEVYAKQTSDPHYLEVEDAGLIYAELGNGANLSIDVSWNSTEALPSFGDLTLEIIGTKGVISIDGLKQQAKVYSNNKSADGYYGDDGSLLMLKDFIRVIREDKPSPISGEDGLYALNLALMAYESIENNAPVRAVK